MITLSIDDQKAARELMSFMLNKIDPGGKHMTASDMDEAFGLLSDEVQIVFLDIELPRMNGIHGAAEMKKRFRNLNIIFVTGHQEYSLEAHELYCSGFLLKPVGERKLKKAFENLRKPLIELSEDFYSQHYQGNDVLGKRIEKYREMRGLSRNDMADLMNVTRQTIFRWEHGERIPDVLTFVRLARILGVEIGELLGINGEA